ncbi:hypothetical protein AV530_003826 [Patagioenas fasciata monilis]|uniref:Uncharacterized protein n=1 Tax=Patagioenas fasciata monilis TaxID=372326 RepID=A0A1V4KZ44_PATFA|nr:hypothetical protein AV530_003826 [Patagioenas fasciata monilis]
MHSVNQLQRRCNNHTVVALKRNQWGSNPGHKKKPEFSDQVEYLESARGAEILHLCVAYSAIPHLGWEVASMTECRWMISCAQCKYQTKFPSSDLQRHKVRVPGRKAFCWLSHLQVPLRKEKLASETPLRAASAPQISCKYAFIGQAGITGY